MRPSSFDKLRMKECYGMPFARALTLSLSKGESSESVSQSGAPRLRFLCIFAMLSESLLWLGGRLTLTVPLGIL